MTEDPAAIDVRVVAAAAEALRGSGRVTTPSPAAAAALTAAGLDADVVDLRRAPPGGADAVALIADELSTAGDHAEGLIDAAVTAVRPGGLVAVSALSATLPGNGEARRYRADEVSRAMGHRGITVRLLCAPGAGALVAGDPNGGYDPERDRLPGLVDAAPRIVAVGTAPRDEHERGSAFFASLPYKIVAAAVLCRDDDNRLLCVHDTFKGFWTIPGGVVDAHEDPRTAAVREAWEEAGVRVAAGPVLGVFSASWPDRVVLVYEAHPLAGAAHRSGPVHAHEIDAVAWVPIEEALSRLAPHVSEQVRSCLDDPGGTLRQTRA